MQQRWSATQKEAFVVYQPVLKFNMHLRGAEYILYCSHKPIEPFLSKGRKIPKLDKWAMKLPDYNIIFGHIKGSNNNLADPISRLKTLDIYRDPIENPEMLKASDLQSHITELNTSKIHTLNSNVLHAEQRWDIACKNDLSNPIVTKNFCQW